MIPRYALISLSSLSLLTIQPFYVETPRSELPHFHNVINFEIRAISDKLKKSRMMLNVGKTKYMLNLMKMKLNVKKIVNFRP